MPIDTSEALNTTQIIKSGSVKDLFAIEGMRMVMVMTPSKVLTY